MRLDFSRAALAEALLHLAIWAAAASISGCAYPEIPADAPEQADSDRVG